MIISKKKFNEAIANAVREKEDEMFKERELENGFRYVREDMDRLERRIRKIEDELHPADNGKCNEVISCR